MSRHNDGRPILAYETTYRNETQKRVATFPMKLGVRARGRKRGRREGGSFVFFFFFFFSIYFFIIIIFFNYQAPDEKGWCAWKKLCRCDGSVCTRKILKG